LGRRAAPACYNLAIEARQNSFTYYARVFGCQMNVADVDDIGARLALHGGVRVERPEEADLVLVNTCTVRQKAEDKAMSFFGNLKHVNAPLQMPVGAPVKAPLMVGAVPRGGLTAAPTVDIAATGKKPFIVAMGCVVPKARKFIEQTFPHIDLLVNYSDPDIVLAELIDRFPPLAGRTIEDSFPPLLQSDRALPSFVTAIRGCNHRCSFCVVPWSRGPQRDVPLEQVVAQAIEYEKAGAPDITVLGQSIMAYGKASPQPHPDFVDLMQALLRQTGFRWITYLTSLACDMTDRVCEEVIANPRVTPLLHLPVQSGSDKVLGEMRRQYDTDQYRRMVRKARHERPDLYLTTDLLVGFPTETNEDYEQTLALVEEIGFDDAFMFAYSPRPGTHSVRVHPDSIPREEKIARLSRLIAMQRAQSAERSKRYIGQELETIIESSTAEGAVARTAFNKPVHMAEARTPVGQFARVRITGVRVSGFTGEELHSS
jgi:tRNA-2-methylthio-N6-dimethylallyladenosine synthase